MDGVRRALVNLTSVVAAAVLIAALLLSLYVFIGIGSNFVGSPRREVIPLVICLVAITICGYGLSRVIVKRALSAPVVICALFAAGILWFFFAVALRNFHG